jgi:MFS family permease
MKIHSCPVRPLVLPISRQDLFYRQIGLIVSINWDFQIVLALLSGVITDKLGRRRTTLIAEAPAT